MVILVTSALPYVNNEPHCGNLIGSTLSADVFSRYLKKIYGSENVLYVCGTDEYGTTTEVRAKQEGISCRELCDKYNKIHKEIYDFMNIKFDVFGRTSTDTQTKIAQKIFLKLYDEGYLIEKDVSQMYCENCQKFLADRYIIGICYHEECKGGNISTRGDQCDNCKRFIDVLKLIQPKCTICSSKPIIRESTHLFLDLPKFTDCIKDWFIDSKCCKLSKSGLEITKAFLAQGLEQKPITRDLSWGTPVPTSRPGLKKYANKVMYVWFDAPIGYLSIIEHDVENANLWFSCDKWYQFMAKDNVPFHTIVFPATLFGYNSSDHMYPLPTEIMSSNYLLYEDQKFSKTNNIGIFGTHIIKICSKLSISVDYFRFYLIKTRPELKDTNFSWSEFIRSIKADLVGNYGNYINRCISLSKKFFNNITIEYLPEEFAEDREYLRGLEERYSRHMEEGQLKDALVTALNVSDYGNKFLQREKPWIKYSEYKSSKNIQILNDVMKIIQFSLYICNLSADMFSPIMPNTSDYILNYIGFNGKVFEISKDSYILPFRAITDNEIQECLTYCDLSK